MSTTAVSHPAFVTPAALPLRGAAARPAIRAGRAAPRASAAPPEPPHRSSATADWRAFRAHLAATRRASVAPTHHGTLARRAVSQPVAHWAHALPTGAAAWPEVGSCLVCRAGHEWPDAFAHLERAVVLVTDVGDGDGGGVTGLLLTRATQHTVGSLRSAVARAGAEFADNAVWLGGDCSTGSLDVLHSYNAGAVAGSEEVVPGLWRGGFNSAREGVRDGRLAAERFRFFVAYARWTRQALQAEMRAGAWGVVACAPGLILDKRAANEKDFLWKTLSAHV